MTILERAGQAGVVVTPFFYSISCGTLIEKVLIAAAVLFLLFYYAGWLRYFLKGRHLRLLYEPMLKIPLPMAVSPLMCFFAGAVFLSSIPLFISAIVLSIGHLYNSYKAYSGERV
ncbi:MAG: hypothetical protein ABSG94_05950 [Brevinematales bacterium]